MNALEPANPTERKTAAKVHETATQVTTMALMELRRADTLRDMGSELVDHITQETWYHREGGQVLVELYAALASLQRAEQLTRARGEVNGH